MCAAGVATMQWLNTATTPVDLTQQVVLHSATVPANTDATSVAAGACDGQGLWVTPDPPPGAPLPTITDGAFSVELDVAGAFAGDPDAIDCMTDDSCGVFIRRDHVGGGADWITHVVETIEECHQGVVFSGEIFRAGHFECRTITYACVLGGLAGLIDGRRMIVVPIEVTFRKRLRHQNG